MSALADQIRRGDSRALARGLTLIENRAPEADSLLVDLHRPGPGALRIGVTGAPGVGKSTLVDRIATEMRHGGSQVAILAVDPSSPFSGGAVLGDRVRMQRHHADPGVFIRSMASRGELGGLAPAVSDALTLLEASGRDAVLIETAGVGQSEIDVVQVAGTIAVVLAPATGDDIQAAKAGIMEIADLFVINKADQPGAEELERQLLAMISLTPEGRPKPPVLRASAMRCEGIGELVAEIRTAESRRPGADYWKRVLRRRIEGEFRGLLAAGRVPGLDLDAAAKAVAAGTLNPYTYARQVLEQLQREWNR